MPLINITSMCYVYMDVMLTVVSSFLPPDDVTVCDVGSVHASIQWSHPCCNHPLSTSKNQLLGIFATLIL